MTQAAVMAKPPLLEAFAQGSLGRRRGTGSARAASARRTCGGALAARAGGPTSPSCARSPE
eukprot:8168452-Alexandrium_andersonii.AAC.1